MVLLLGCNSSASAQALKPMAGPDHGMVLAAALDVSPGLLKDTTNLADTRNYVFRGRLITLNDKRNIHLCFDTEHLRVAGAWQGTYPAYTPARNMGPTVHGTMIFATQPGPGWAHQGRWDDPRPAGEGPLPRSWGHYRGLYLHGDKVVLSYSVGETKVLELPGSLQTADFAAITRTFEFGPSPQPQELLVLGDAKNPWQGQVTSSKDNSNPLVRDNALALQSAKKSNPENEYPIAVAMLGAPAGTQWLVDKGRLRLNIPPLPKGGIFQIILTSLPANKTIDDFAAILPSKLLKPSDFIRGGPARWREEITTQGTRGTADKSPFAHDAIGLPEANPWGATVRFAGLDFFKDGRAALCTWDGDVWIVSGLDDTLSKVRWKRFAAGLQQPLGLKIVNDVIYTAGRDQITRLVDLNGDGEADFYENFNNDPGLTLQRHEFVMGLETDSAGNFYYCRSGHYIASKAGANCCLYKLSPDGQKLEIVANGFREPNGPCLGPDDLITLGDNEGNGIPQTPLYQIKPGAFYGFTPPPPDKAKGGNTWTYTQKPIVWLPKTVDRSAGSQVWVPSKTWGPFAGQLLHTSYGDCKLFSVLIDKTAEPWQGAVWKFPLFFPSGIMRARFNPLDGQLYLCGLRGWDNNGSRDGVFSRVRLADPKIPIPLGFEAIKNGLRVRFSESLDKASAEDDQNWAGTFATTWTSKHADLSIASATLSADGKTATVILDSLRPTVNFSLQYRVKSAAGPFISGELHGTLHRIP